jgi:hypothetical protein
MMAAVFFLICLMSDAIANQNITTSAKIWKYDNLCDLPKPINQPGEIIFLKGNYSGRGCQDVEKLVPHPAAVCVTVTNQGGTKINFLIDDLQKVTLRKEKTKPAASIAWFAPMANPLGAGRSFMFLLEMTSKMELVIEPGRKADLIFLFHSAAAGDKVQIGNVGPITIQ